MRYRALMDCVFDGDYYAQGAIFEGRTLEGHDKETAKHLEFLDEDTPAPKKGKKNAADDEL